MKRIYKKLFIFMLVVVIGGSLNVISISSEELDINNNTNVKSNLGLVEDAPSAILMECSTGTIIYEKDAHKRRAPASMTKIMTMILIMDALKNNVIKIDQVLVASENAAEMGGTQIYLEAGEQMTVEELLKAIAMASANDATVVFAEAIGGSIDNFVKKMNDKALELDLKNTHFSNTNGLPTENHYSSSYDMAIMGCYLVNEYEDTILKYTNIYEDYLRKGKEDEFWLVNTNKLVRFYPEVDGLKTGWTNDAGYCLTATMKRNGIRFVSVIMGSSSSAIRNSETMNLLNYGASVYELYPLLKEGDIIDTINDITMKPQQYSLIVPKDINIVIKKGEKVGTINKVYENMKLKIYIDDVFYQEVDLKTETNITKANFFDIVFEVMKRLFLGNNN